MVGPALQLDVAQSVVLNASGNGSVKLGPTSTRAVWHVTNAAVTVSSNTLEPQAILYQNTKASKLAGTNTGSNDSTNLDVWVRNGFILCEWTGGDPGATATLFLYGTIEIGG